MKAFAPDFFSSIIADLYDCALQPELWSKALTRVNEAVGGAYTTISLSDPQFAMPRMAAHSPWDPVMLKILNEEYGIDGVPGLREVAFGDIDTPRSTLDQMTEAEFQQSKFYQDWVRPQGLRDGCVMKFVQTADRIGAMAFITRANRDIITADERRFMALISPHVRRAAMIGDLLDHQRVQTHLFQQALDRVATPVLLVDGAGRILYANEQAEARLSAGLHIRKADGRLQPANAAMVDAFDDAVARTRSTPAELGARGVGIPIAAPDQAAAVAYVLPLMNSESRVTHASAVAAVFIASSAGGAPPQHEVLATLYDLTPSEARVMLQIGSGQTVSEIAATIGVSENTIKTHLGRVFSKTGSARQSDIVRIVTALSPPVAP
jgi:DNA-binding CsgD family transcriptional regulator/PAS domain-containing protein